MAKNEHGTAFPGLCLIGLFVTGLTGLAFGAYAALRLNNYVGAGICLLSAAAAFGVAVHVAFRE